MASVKVAVRVRPLNSRELNMDSKCIIEMEGKRTSILNLKLSTYTGDKDDSNVQGRERVKDFFFDYSYWSFCEKSENFTNQTQVFKDLGSDVLQSAEEGYNACIFAYGQTGSGKTHTMMGQKGNEGLIPRICNGLFQMMSKREDEGVSFRTEVSYLEIYNEKVRDLLRPVAAKAPTHVLRVREHPKDGPYVQGLTKHLVSDYSSIEALLQQGNDLRTTASTNMNDTSSRSHAIFTISFTQAKFFHDMPSETVSKLNLVDLAGSERADATGATGVRLKEGGNINKSLVTLGSVISSLAELSTNPHRKKLFIPYRDSVLTWLLKDSLGGNSKTVMIATISPAECNYAETLSTLRYANRAKNIINKPTVNEDTNVKLIRDLRSEIDRLKLMLRNEGLSDAEKAAAKKLSENEERLVVLTDKWKDRWKETQKIMQERELALQRHQDAGIRMDSDLPHLVALEEDLFSTGILLYHLRAGKTFVGKKDSSKKIDIGISGSDTQDAHCMFENQDDGVVIDPFPHALCSVNGDVVTKRTRLQQGDVIILGKTNIFRFNHPAEAQVLREKRKSFGNGVSNLSKAAKFNSETDLLAKLRASPDNIYEQREAALSRQLDEARHELEKQKHDEERKLEEARQLFSRQIKEESKRLEETRQELEQQRRSRLQDVQSVDDLRKHLLETEKRHYDAEGRRQSRLSDLSATISSTDKLVEKQQKLLQEIEKECHAVKGRSDAERKEMLKVFVEARAGSTERLKNEIGSILASNKDRDGDGSESQGVDEDQLRSTWERHMNEMDKQDRIVVEMRNTYHELVCEFESLESVSDEGKVIFAQEKATLLDAIDKAQQDLDTLHTAKENELRPLLNDVKSRFNLLAWEKDLTEQKLSVRKEVLEEESKMCARKQADAEAILHNSKLEFKDVLKVEKEARKLQEAVLKEHENEASRVAASAEKEFSLEVKKYQENINAKQLEYDAAQNEVAQLETQMRALDSGSSQDEMLETFELKRENLANIRNEATRQRQTFEKAIQDALEVMNLVKLESEAKLAECQESVSKEQQVSREKLLLLQETVDEAEKHVVQCKTTRHGVEERVKQLENEEETIRAKSDAELLYISYLLEKEVMSRDGGEASLETISQCKVELQEITNDYKLKARRNHRQSENSLRAIVERRGEAQVALDDLMRSRGINEVALNSTTEMFVKERQEELDYIDSLREKLADMEEEKEISVNLGHDEITHENGVTGTESDDKRKLLKEMETKLRDVEAEMAAKVEELKTREEFALSALKSEREIIAEEKEKLKTNILQEKESLQKELEQNKTRDHDMVMQLQSKLEENEAVLDATREQAKTEIDQLQSTLERQSREIVALQVKLRRYASMTSLVLDSRHDYDTEDDPAGTFSGSGDDGDDDVEPLRFTPPRISPPPTPIHKFISSIRTYKKNQITVCIPRYILRGLGRGSYHVFEVRLLVGDEDGWSVFRRYRRFRELHLHMCREYPVVQSLAFPSKRFFGNRAEEFVRARRAQLEAYMKALLAILGNVPHCPIAAMSTHILSKQDIGRFHSFFKQGMFEYGRYDTE